MNETGITGTRTFIQSPNGAVTTLPVIGDTMVDPDGNDVTTCKLRSIRSVYHDGHGESRKLVFSYSTAGGGAGAGGSRTPRNVDDRQFNGGSEIVVVDGDAFTWYGGSDAVNVPVVKRIATGSFTVPRLRMTAAEKATWFSTHFLAKVGKVNNATFEGFRAGSVYFESITGGNATDEDGAEIWNFTCNFMWRYNQEVAGDDWQYVLDVDSGTFKKPVRGATNLYDTADFGAMFP